MKMKKFLENNPLITVTAVPAPENPTMASSEKWEGDHWYVTIGNLISGKNMSLYYSKGIGLRKYKGKCRPLNVTVADEPLYVPIKPTLNEILDCLAMDSSGVEGNDFESWAADLGWDTDSRKAEKTYLLVQKQAADLRSVLGPHLYQTLLYEVERD